MATKVGKASHLNDAVIAATSFRVQTSDGNKEKKSAQGPDGKEQGKPSKPCGCPKEKGAQTRYCFSSVHCIEGAGLQVLLQTCQKRKQHRIDQYDLTYDNDTRKYAFT
jgi:hypothetical protein